MVAKQTVRVKAATTKAATTRATVKKATASSAVPQNPGPAWRRRIAVLAPYALAVLGLAWWGATLGVSNAAVLGNSDYYAVALEAMAFALPNLVAATLLAGAATSLGILARAGADAPARRRLVIGLATGAVLGAVSTGLVLWAYGSSGLLLAAAVTVGVAGLVGGAGAALPRTVLTAGVIATIGVLLLGLLVNFIQPGLLGLFGGRETVDSVAALDAEVNADYTVAYLVAIVGGLIAGLLTFWILRRRPEPVAWPWYLVAGIAPGAALLLTELLTRTGGFALLDAARGASALDRVAMDFAAFARLRNGMVVFFVGGLAALIAVGRTMRRASEPTP